MPEDKKFDFTKDFATPQVVEKKEPKPVQQATIYNFDDFMKPKVEVKKEEKKEQDIIKKIRNNITDPINPKIDFVQSTPPIGLFGKEVPKELIEKKEEKVSDDQNKIELVEYFDEHWYKLANRIYPSVTTILTCYPNKLAGIMNWRGEVGNIEASRKLKEAGEKGSFVHEMKTRMLMGTKFYYGFAPEDAKQPYEVIRDQELYIQIYRLYQFFLKVKPKIIMDEMKLFSDKYEIAGSADLLLEIKDGNYMIDGQKPIYLPAGYYIADLKTSNYLHPEYWCQVAAYSKMFEERFPEYHIRGTLILHTKANNKYGIEGFGCKVILDDSEKNIDDYFNDFMTVYACWKILGKTGPKEYTFPKEFQLQNIIGA